MDPGIHGWVRKAGERLVATTGWSVVWGGLQMQHGNCALSAAQSTKPCVLCSDKASSSYRSRFGSTPTPSCYTRPTALLVVSNINAENLQCRKDMFMVIQTMA